MHAIPSERPERVISATGWVIERAVLTSWPAFARTLLRECVTVILPR
jgi:hypothetical protein